MDRASPEWGIASPQSRLKWDLILEPLTGVVDNFTIPATWKWMQQRYIKYTWSRILACRQRQCHTGQIGKSLGQDNIQIAKTQRRRFISHIFQHLRRTTPPELRNRIPSKGNGEKSYFRHGSFGLLKIFILVSKITSLLWSHYVHSPPILPSSLYH